MATTDAFGKPDGCGMPKSSPAWTLLMMSFNPSAPLMPRKASSNCPFCSLVVSLLRREVHDGDD
eukprot:CAMPEP_0170306732 /NCGR_PEP_ID=MMETSP0116_2-20130129/53762_1 /TAXON_ID=400756 /ORGANISM="Durinskia baltica, Strain CSIRO CS-38" /LENGTH=63 /DNA_ID=CAMNT_0010558827 /DNA_START=23 /DNA_END=211 /DNA_ORIENTATION=-